MSEKKLNLMEKIAMKELEEATKKQKETVLDSYRNLYDDEHMKELYKKELPKFFDYLSNKKDQKLKKITQEEDDDDIVKVKVDEKKMKSKIMQTLDAETYESIFVETISYIKANIYHGYDSKYYVLNKNSDGHVLPLEYGNADFTNTFGKYFPDQIKKWFDMYSRKFVLSINNTKPRSYKEDTTNYLNLFSGYRFDKNIPEYERDLKRIEKGDAGVKFILNHIFEIWNSRNEKCYEYDMNWIYKLVAGYKLNTMLYLKGKMGRGKTAIVNFLKLVIGSHICMTISNDAPFMTEFNGSLIGIVLCCLDEVVHDFESFKSLYNKLKPYITDSTMSYRNLYEKLKTLKNLTSFIMTGNYDMLKLDDPSKGDDRRIKVNDVSDVIKDREYCDQLDAYLNDPDVQYSFFWHCIKYHNPNWNELQELKLLPVSETKKQMIVQSLDTATLFLKANVNNNLILNINIKPKDLYYYYVEYMKKSIDKRQFLNQNTFLTKMKDFSSFVTTKLGVRVNGGNPTNYFYIDRKKMIKLFKEKYFFNEYDDIHDKLEQFDEDSEAEELPLIAQLQNIRTELYSLQVREKQLIKQVEREEDLYKIEGFQKEQKLRMSKLKTQHDEISKLEFKKENDKLCEIDEDVLNVKNLIEEFSKE